MFGVSSAPEEYQKIVQQVLQNCEGTNVIADDITVHGSDVQTHDCRLEKVLATLCDRNLTLNSSKCNFGFEELSFMRHILSKNGIRPTEEKVRAVKDAKRPKNVSEVRSFLGLVNYCGRYIRNLSSIEKPLRRLTCKNVTWYWGNEHEKSFQELKHKLVSSESMAYFNPNALTQVIVDASPVGLGAILVQKSNGSDFKPVIFASRSLTDVERRYLQTEKEALGVVWACERFRLYLLGMQFELITDHKPLEVIYWPKSKPPLHIERWAFRLLPFNFKVKYRLGKYDAADALSRLPLADTPKVNMVEEYIYFIARNATPVALTTREIEQCTGTDTEMRNILKAIKTDDWSGLPEFKSICNDITNIGYLVLRGHKIVVPKPLRTKILELAHEGHQGTVKCKSRLRQKVWWPGIDRDVEKFVKSCKPCLLMSASNKPEPLQPTPLPDRPWQHLGIDLCGPFSSGEHLLVAVDYYSRWFEIRILNTINSQKVIKCLDNWFTCHGLPDLIVSDNGTPFTSQEFKDFLGMYKIVHRKVTLYSLQANGEVERQNRTILKAIKNFVVEEKNWKSELNTILKAYRSTPHSVTNVSPAELLFSRKIRAKLPDFCLDFTAYDEDVRDRDCLYIEKGKQYYDKRCHVKDDQVKVGDIVVLQQKRENKMSPMFSDVPHIVLEKKGKSVQLEDIDGIQKRRNAIHMKSVNFEKGGINRDSGMNTEIERLNLM